MASLPGQVLIQTFHPEHYCLKLVAQHDYEGFFEKEIRFRKVMHYPPFTSLANLLVRDRNLEKAAHLINSIGKIVQRTGCWTSPAAGTGNFSVGQAKE